ncbi:hypothetical protein F4678DRAFT_134265 [Xylaria arbuscula]|nr:hypothetical protein F4678DRAFT_134265 [Xylaria arbuscula]
MKIMTLPAPQPQNNRPKLLHPFPSHNHHIDACDNTPNQLPGVPQQAIQCESNRKPRKSTGKWTIWVDSISINSKNPITPQPLILSSPPAEVSSLTQPVNISVSNNEVQAHGSFNNVKSDGEPETSGVVHTNSQLKQATASNDHNPRLQSPAAPSAPDLVAKEHCNEIMPCGLSSKDVRLSSNPQPTEAVDTSICDTPLDPHSLPIRTKMRSGDSKKYSLRSYGDKEGLYYSSTIWPEELPYRSRNFFFGQLRTDLNNHIQKACKERKYKRAMRKNRVALTGQAFTIELRFSGKIEANEEDIALRPTIWVICASELYKRLVEEALSQCQLSWALDEHIEVVKGLNFNKRRERVENLDLSDGLRFADSYRLHIHTEAAGKDGSACGLITCATLTKGGSIIDQCISRIGGLLLLDHEVVCASSTAHGILDMLMSAGIYPAEEGDLDSSRDIPDTDTENQAENDSSVGTDSESDDESIISARDPDCDDRELLKDTITSSITHWNVVPNVIIFDFLRTAMPNQNKCWTLGAEVRAHDFALFEIGCDPFQKLSNSYESELVRHTIKTEDTQDNDGLRYSAGLQDVMILLGHNTFARGRMLPGISNIYMGEIEFSTSRILLDTPLAPGTSGSWVVSDGFLQGVIIASYGQEPIAHMIPIQELFRDVKSALPSLMSIGLPPVRDQNTQTTSEIEKVQTKVDFSALESNRPKILATRSSPALLIWRLPRDISQEELAELLHSTSDWVNVVLLSPKQRQKSTAVFAVVTFQNLFEALRTSEKLDKYHISRQGKTRDAKFLNSCVVIRHGSLKDTTFSNSRVVAAVTDFGLSRELEVSSGAFRNNRREAMANKFRYAKKTAKFDDTKLKGRRNPLDTSLRATGNFGDLSIRDYLTLEANPPCNMLYIANLPTDMSEEKVKSMVVERRGYKRMCLRTNQKGTMCFVEFENEAFATRALHELDRQALNEGVKRPIRFTFSKNALGVRSSGISSVRDTLDKTDSTVKRSTSTTGFKGTYAEYEFGTSKYETITSMDYYPQITQQ